MWKYLILLLIFSICLSLTACSSTHYISRAAPYKAVIDSLKDSDSELEVKVDGNFYDIIHPSFYGDKVYYKNSGKISNVSIKQVEEIHINKGLDSRTVLFVSSLTGMAVGGLIGAGAKENASKAEGGSFGFSVSEKSMNIVFGIVGGAAVGFTAGVLINLAYQSTDRIVFKENKDE